MAQTRLNEHLRNCIVRAIMDDVPSTDYKEEIKKAAQNVAIELLPPEVRVLAKHPELSQYVRVTSMYLGYIRFSINVFGLDDNDYDVKLREAIEPAVTQLNKLHEAQEEQRNIIESKVRGVVHSARTAEALVKIAPEFEKYLPKGTTAPQYPVVVTDTITELMKAGWPKGKKAEEVAA